MWNTTKNISLQPHCPPMTGEISLLLVSSDYSVWSPWFNQTEKNSIAYLVEFQRTSCYSRWDHHVQAISSLSLHIQWVGKSLALHKIILYLPQVPGNGYHIYMVIYTYSIYIFDMNMRSGSHALLHVEKSEKNGVLRVLWILHVRVYKNMKN